MNEYERALMDKPSVLPDHCVVCGQTYGLASGHHVVFRSAGGEDGPRLRLCGSGTTGCHGDAHQRKLHFRWRSTGWQYLRTQQPMKYEDALYRDGWRDLR